MSSIFSGKTSAGIPVYVDKKLDAKRSGYMVAVRTGSMDEKDDESGISHLLEHVVFRATKTKTSFQMSEEIEGAGGLTNAYTSKTQTAFYAFALNDKKKVAKDLISDIINNTLLSEKDTELEKKIVLQEYAMCINDPESYIHDIFDNVMWRGSALEKDIIGTQESIKSFTNKDLRRYYEEKYKIPNISVLAAGDVDPSEVLAWAEESFDGLGVSKTNLRKAPAKNASIYKHVKRKEDNCYVKFGFRGRPLDDSNDSSVQSIIVGALGNGSSSRYFQEVREKKALVYAIASAQEYFPSVTSLETIYYATSKNVREAIETVASATKKFKEEGFAKGEFERVKNMFKGRMISNLESNRSCLHGMANTISSDRKPLSIDENIERLNRVTEEEVMKLSEEILRPENITVVMLADDVPGMNDFNPSELDF